jgi:hypothetical protein
MQHLGKFQKKMAAALLGSGCAGLDGEVVENGIPAARRLDIYRNNLLITLTDALAQLYPVVERLVGTNYFRQVARGFARRHPPRERSLLNYGGAFADFLTSLPSAAAYPYLGDVARLEWACHLAFHAPDPTMSDLARILELPAHTWSGARVRMSSSLQLIESNYPIFRIWIANQPEEADPPLVELDAGETFTSVTRPGYDVEVRSHTAGDFQFISQLKNGASLQAAYDAATEASGSIDIEALLCELVERRLIIDIEPPEGKRP